MIDTIQKRSIKLLTESFTLTDTEFARISKSMTIETINLTDTLQKKVGTTFTESITLSDSILRFSKKQLTESLTLTDTIIRSLVFTRTLSETLTFTDNIDKFASKMLTESLLLIDVVAAGSRVK
ncbi:unnamed protein product [marine sediment metagenome]|uniref:Uncharacterized protein n=1 Tax=marine sediment metagenome TaxID=412755 RepID=X1CL93_9ZZZZ